ncbi:Subtilisin-like protease SBT1.7 [Linum grandiflorum]
MATLQLQFHFLHLLLLLLLPFSHLSTAEKQTYIVQISTSQLPATTPSSDGAEWYESSLRSVSTTAELLYTYTHAIHGFSTRLTPREAQLLQSQPGILSVTQESIYHLHTTRSPAFLGLDLASDLLPQANTVGEVVVGVLDTGAWPESRSYDDAGFGPVPSSWKGKCEVGTNFTVSHCNRKLIGARFFARGYEATIGRDGHGTHTSTTAAGSAVDGASLFGFAAGTARGMATRARVAVYKVCWMGGCFSSDILAAMDVAIQDGVNVLSMSLDLIAPGVNILAGWRLAADPRRVEFNIISGTSMSCPHVAGLAALVKAAHPEWSPAAVRSALMTTAYVSYKDGKRIQDVFDHGAGHVDPVSALNPGLVYDLTAEDYLSFLCALNYTELQINTVARRNYTCDPKKKHSVADFNYPSFAVNVDTTQIDEHTRTVTNVGASGGVYKVSVTPEQIPGVKIVVEPETLSFKEANEKKGYTVTFMASSMAIGTNRFARLEWSDGKHVAGSSIAVSWS